MSQAQVAGALGVNQKTVANWEASQVPEGREAEVRDQVFFPDSASMLENVSDTELAAEVLRRMSRSVARSEDDQWFGVAPTRPTSVDDDTPEVDA